MATLFPITRRIELAPIALTAGQLAELAYQALIAEAELTPKPGLVDRRGSGAHTDLSLHLMRQSALAIAPYFAAMGAATRSMPFGEELRSEVAAIGRDAEAAMLRATAGSNSHKGAIWILGLLVTAAAQTIDSNPEFIARDAGQLARLPERARPQLISHGEMIRVRYGATGARGEAFSNFPHAVYLGLPALRDARNRGLTERNSRLAALFNIMSCLEDTCVLYRGGIDGLAIVRRGAAEVLLAGGPGSAAGDEAMLRLDRELFTKRLSPGGSADLLAATLFLDALERGQHAIEGDSSFEGDTDDAD